MGKRDKDFTMPDKLPELADKVVEYVQEQGVAVMTLEEATNVLLEAMIPTQRDLFIELADLVLKIPRWQLLLGSVLAQVQEGNLASPYIDPTWVGIQLQTTNKKCEWEECGLEFTPKRLGQRFCSNACGVKANQKMLQEQKSRRVA